MIEYYARYIIDRLPEAATRKKRTRNKIKEASARVEFHDVDDNKTRQSDHSQLLGSHLVKDRPVRSPVDLLEGLDGEDSSERLERRVCRRRRKRGEGAQTRE